MHSLTVDKQFGMIQIFAYPFTLATGLALYLGLIEFGFSTPYAAFLPPLLGLLLILFLERHLPYRDDWKPHRFEILSDATFLVVVQVLLPRFLGLLAALLTLEFAVAGSTVGGLWPSDLPVLVQAALMLTLADLFRYLLHLASHRCSILWRFHSIHHQPDKIYSLNVGRFHPIEKTLQFLLDSLPFVLVGVAPEVIGAYFVFYAINGFFQHCNVDLKFGWLSRVFSTAELHRWHHASDTDCGDCNYGNNLALWDLVFGTYFRPGNSQVETVGVDGHKARGFGASMIEPFTGPDAVKSPARVWRKVFERVLFGIARHLYWKPFARACKSPQQAQLRLLRRILASQLATGFGRRHGFDRIHSYQAFRDAVPVQDYESLRPWIERQARVGEAEICSELAEIYNQTSGSTGLPKYIPISPRSLKAMRRSQVIAALMAREACPEAFDGKALCIASAACEGRNEWGVAVGSASGLILENMPQYARRDHLLPDAVATIGDAGLRYDVIALHALAETNLRFVATANPSTLLQLLNRIRQRWPQYRGHLAGCQKLEGYKSLNPEQKAACDAVGVSAERLVHLDRLFDSEPGPNYAELWPELRLVMTWTGGSCGVPLGLLRRSLPPNCRLMELGYLASEMRGTITLADRHTGVPAITENFYEFQEVSDYESGIEKFRMLHEIEQGKFYYVYVTNWNGLYRYHMNDIVQVQGRFGQTPCIRFVQKGKGVTSITGEKLYESHLTEALGRLRESLGMETCFHVCLADETGRRYRLYAELGSPVADHHSLADALDRALAEINCEYRSKRQSGRLLPIEIELLKAGTGARFKAYHVARGQRENQFKVMTLQYARDFDFDAFVREEVLS